MLHFRFLFLALLISIAQDTLARSADELLIVDCLLPGQIRKLGQRITYLTARQAIKTSAQDCEIRGGEYVAYGRANPVLDAGEGNHSVFAKALLDVLKANSEIFEGGRFHREVAARVAYAAGQLQVEQVPEYAPIKYAGHDFGDFFFVPVKTYVSLLSEAD